MALKKEAETVKEDTKEVRYSLSNLRNYSKELFNVSKSVFDGATVSLNKEKDYTVAEVKEAISNWLNTPISKKKEEK